jgi:hypothetical protein
VSKLDDLLATARVIATSPHVHTFVAQFATDVLEARLVPVDSADCDQLTLAMAILDHTATRILTGPEHDDYRARLASAFELLKRIVMDSMIQSPQAREFLAGKEATGG